MTDQTPTIPTDGETAELLAKLRNGTATQADKVTFMRGAVYHGALARGKSAAEAAELALAPAVEQLGLSVKVE